MVDGVEVFGVAWNKQARERMSPFALCLVCLLRTKVPDYFDSSYPMFRESVNVFLEALHSSAEFACCYGTAWLTYQVP